MRDVIDSRRVLPPARRLHSTAHPPYPAAATTETEAAVSSTASALPLAALLLFGFSYANLWIMTRVPGLDWLQQTLPRVVLFTLLIGYVALTWLPRSTQQVRLVHIRRLRHLVALGIAAVNVLLPTVFFINDRLASGVNSRNVIDWPLQIEAGSRLLLDGKSPYGVDYSFSEMQRWSIDANFPENPAIRHAIHLPVNFLLGAISLPLWESLTGWYDARILLIAAYLAVLVVSPYLASRWEDGHALQISLALNPILVESFVVGLSDYLLLAMIVGWLALRVRDRHRAAALVLGVAVATRQFSWLLLPIYLAGEWFALARHPFSERWRLLARQMWPLPLVALSAILPFFLTNPRGFYEDVIAFGSGNIADAYPIGGPHTYGISVFVLAYGLVESQTSYFPFGSIQLLATLPVMAAAIWLQQRHNTARRLLINYFLVLSVFLFTGRFMHTNYVGYLFALLLLAYFTEPHDLNTSRNRLPGPQS